MKVLLVLGLVCLIMGNSFGAEKSNELNNLFKALREGNITLVQQMIEENSKLLNQKNWLDGDTPLNYAARMTNDKDLYELIKVLVDAGSDINSKNYLENTPLINIINRYYSMSEADKKKTIQLLMKKSKLMFDFNEKGFSALHYAVEDCYPNLVELLIEQGAKVDRFLEGQEKIKVTEIPYSESFRKLGRFYLLSPLNKTPLEYIVLQHYLKISDRAAIKRESCTATIEVLLKNGANTKRKIFGEKTTEDLLKELGLGNLLTGFVLQQPKVDITPSLINFAQDLAALA